MTADPRRPGGMSVRDAAERIAEAHEDRLELAREPWKLASVSPLRPFAERVEAVLVELLRDHGVEVER